MLIPSRGYYPSLDEASFGRIGRFFNGDSTSELGLRSSLSRDIWTAAQPDLSAVEPAIKDADRRFPHADAQLEGFLVSTVVRRYLQCRPRRRLPADRVAARGVDLDRRGDRGRRRDGRTLARSAAGTRARGSGGGRRTSAPGPQRRRLGGRGTGLDVDEPREC